MDDVEAITFFVDKYKYCHTIHSRSVVQQQAKKALSVDDYIAFIDFAIAWLAVIDPVGEEDLPL